MRLFRSDEGDDVRVEIDYAVAEGFADSAGKEVNSSQQRERWSLFPL